MAKLTRLGAGLGCSLVVFQIALVVFVIGCWISNLISLIHLFKNHDPDTNHIVIHAIGLIPGCSVVTCWF